MHVDVLHSVISKVFLFRLLSISCYPQIVATQSEDLSEINALNSNISSLYTWHVQIIAAKLALGL